MTFKDNIPLRCDKHMKHGFHADNNPWISESVSFSSYTLDFAHTLELFSKVLLPKIEVIY